MMIRSIAVAVLLLGAPALAQDKGSLNPRPLPPLANPNDPALAAKELFGRQQAPANLSARSIGGYARGCVAGATALPIDGETWQVMRLSRNRNWGHPQLIAYLERLSRRVPQVNGWPGLLVGDIAQPRGGPMITGHASHQIGLDADIWLTPMPERRLSRLEREEMSATNVVRADWLDVDPRVWTPQHQALLKAVASERSVARVFVNPAIKKALCRDAGADRSWLTKIRPTYGHNYHFHIRLACPSGAVGCSDQDPPPPGDGCGADLAYWFKPEVMNPRPGPPRPPLTLAQLPAECRSVLVAP
ncbi:penicillin-insensitive murein endopeptidase [Microvirga pudoricolor]|uniref:penicillin-insensitive murein endopeptidase n=1 Tax=Microvirga pudoricolor TaxID=2778729 RepID=UPI001E2AEA9C|nr:penicillin-insensitive murein endopeptidase [Microvirga pudoricolor]